MPLYEYECQQCHRRTEKIQKFSDAELTVCPHCGGPLERTITAAAISFKGSGWYKDLYSSAKPAPSGDSSSEKSSDSKSDSGNAASGGADKAAGSNSADSSSSSSTTESAKPSAPSTPAPTTSASTTTTKS